MQDMDMTIEQRQHGELGPVLARYEGGANTPAHGLRMNTSRPLAVLEIHEAGLTLRIRPRLAGADELVVRPASIHSVFLVRLRLRTRAVGFQLPDCREWYFWDGHPDEILDLLARLGYPIGEPGRHTKIWTATP
jgi:hypothetical protein